MTADLFQPLTHIMLLPCDPNGFWWEICYHSSWFSPKDSVHFSLVFRGLIVLNLDENFFGLSYFGFIKLLESVALGLLQNLRNFGHYFLENFFNSPLHTPFLFAFQQSNATNIKLFFIIPQIWGSVQFFQYIFTLLFRLDNVYCSVFLSTNSFLCGFCSAGEPMHWNLHFSCYSF